MNKLANRARELGQEAFIAGLGQAPVLNKELIDLVDSIKECETVGSAIPVYKAYLDGWHFECDKFCQFPL